jgi:hypothetical protein
MKIRRWHIFWVGWELDSLFERGMKFNGGGYLYGASPYRYLRIGPIKIMRYI